MEPTFYFDRFSTWHVCAQRTRQARLFAAWFLFLLRNTMLGEKANNTLTVPTALVPQGTASPGVGSQPRPRAARSARAHRLTSGSELRAAAFCRESSGTRSGTRSPLASDCLPPPRAVLSPQLRGSAKPFTLRPCSSPASLSWRFPPGDWNGIRPISFPSTSSRSDHPGLRPPESAVAACLTNRQMDLFPGVDCHSDQMTK